MKRIMTPELYIGRNELINIHWNLIFCLNDIEKLWYLPRSATKFWFQIVQKPEANSVEIELREITHTSLDTEVVWRMVDVDADLAVRGFEEGAGLIDLLKGLIRKDRWTKFHVRLLYE